MNSESFKPPVLERLEPRILLSGDGLLSISSPDHLLDPVDQVFQNAELLDGQENFANEELKVRQETNAPDQSEIEHIQPIMTLSVGEDCVPNEEEFDGLVTESDNTPENKYALTAIVEATVERELATNGSVESVEDGNIPINSNDVDVSTEYATSIEIRGPPANETVRIETGSTPNASDNVWSFRALEGQNDLTLRSSGNDESVLELVDNINGAVLARHCLVENGCILIQGLDDVDDTLTIDFSVGLSYSLDIEFNGGKGGFDSLLLAGDNSFTAEYTAIGTDSGIIRLSNESVIVTISFTGLEPVTVHNFTDYTFTSGGGADVITIDSPATGQNRILGTSGGVPFESVTFYDVVNLTIDTATNDLPGDDADLITIDTADTAGWVASGLQTVTILTGDGDDVLNVLPSATATITYDAGPGLDELNVDPGSGTAVIGTNSVLVTGMQPVNYDAQTEQVNIIASQPTPTVPVCVDSYVNLMYGTMRYDRRTRQFSVDVMITNTSNTVIGCPVWLVINSISLPGITLVHSDGTTSDGKEYVDLSGLFPDNKFDPWEDIITRLYFNNPYRRPFTIDLSVYGVIAIRAPVITVDTLLTNDSTPQLTGTVDNPGATITVTVSGNSYGAVNNGDGTWTLADNTISPALADGTYDVQASATDPAGNTGNDATTDELTIDTTAPIVTVDTLLTNDNTPPLTGAIDDAAAVISVTVSGNTYAAVNNGDGTWTLADNTISPALADGTYDVQALATDPAGNMGTDTTTDELTIDTTAPIVTVDTLLTNDNTPPLTGSVDDPVATISITVVGNTYAAINNGDGTWTLVDDTINPALADGTYDVAASATDLAGNTGNDATTDELTIDTTAPVVTVDTLLTNDNTPALSGTINDAAATISVTVGGNSYAAVNNSDSTWTLPDDMISPALADGTYDVQTSATDQAGNTGTDATTNELTVDTTAPVVTVDNLLTNDSTPELTGAVDDPGAVIGITVDGNVYSAVNNADGTWTLLDNTISPALADGIYDVGASSTDLAGNTGTDATTDELTIDTTAPVVTVDSLLTNDNTPPLTGTVNDPATVISVTVAGNSYGVSNNADGTWTLADDMISPALADGTYDVAASVTDLAGNTGTDSTTDELTVDTTAPEVTVDTLLTNDNTPPLTGTVNDQGATITVTVAGNSYAAVNNTDGTWTLPDDAISFALADGVYDVEAGATDLAGNIGNDTTTDELTIDTTAPLVTVDYLLTNDNTPALTGTVDNPGATILVTVGGNSYGAVNNGDGTWTLADDTISPALADGTYDVEASATDLAGNTGNDATTDELTVDTTAPIVTVDTLLTNDNTPPLTGSVDDPVATISITVVGNTYAAINNGDGTWTLVDDTISPALPDGTYDVAAIATDLAGNVGTDATTDELTVDTTPPVVTVDYLLTNDNTPELTGTIDDPDATVLITVYGSTYAAVNNGDSTWTLLDDTISPALPDGTYDVAATATDLAGNVGTDATTDELTVDTTPPVVTVDPLLTSDNTPQLTGTLDDPDATVLITVYGSTYTAVNNGDGTWTLLDDTISPALSDGIYDVAAAATDLAGNIGTDTTTDELIVDTTPPVVTVDTLLTNDNNPQLTGTVDDPAATVLVTVYGSTYTAVNNGDGTWTLPDDTISPALPDGTYDVAATATDQAGNVGTDATTNELTVDMISPAVTVDTLLTNDNTPALTGTVDDAAAVISVIVGGNTYAAINNGDGTWTMADDTISPALADGIYDVQASATDPAGNTGNDATTDELTVDTMPPVVTVDFLLTNDNTPQLTGTVDDPAATVLVGIGGNSYSAINNGDGTWTLPDDTITPPLADGVYDVSIVSTDPAGNVGTDSTLDELTVDTTPPVVDFNLASASDSDPVGDDQTIFDIVTLVGSTEPNIGVSLFHSSDLTSPIATGTSDSAGSFSFSGIALVIGNNPFAVTATDLAGNTGSSSRTIVREQPFVAHLVEGTNFEVEYEQAFVVPAAPSFLSFTYSNLFFDQNDDFINDAFEAALLDSNGNSLVHSIAGRRDAFFNITEALPAVFGANIVVNGQTVSIDLSHIPGGTDANLVIRLVNDDSDTTTEVYITDVSLVAGSLGTPIGTAFSDGIATPSAAIDFTLLSDVTASVKAEYGRTSFDEESDVLFAGLQLENAGTYIIDTPLIVVIDHLSDPTVNVVGADGVTSTGQPYFDFSSLVVGNTLDPNERTNLRDTAFYNPNGIQFSYDLVILGKLNHAPQFVSTPDTEALAGRPYNYDADATDLDGDVLVYSLLSAPQAMTIDPSTGLIDWQPTTGDTGNHNVIVHVEDGRGGSDDQAYTLSVLDNVPNRPPVFTSTPVVDANVNAPYVYDADAIDPDSDPLTFALINGPSGLTIDPVTGLVQWTPTGQQVGQHNVEIQVADGRGGTALQSYTISVQSDPSNNPPVIISTPVTSVAPGQDYTYDVDSIDPDNDPLTYSLIQGPALMTIDPGTGVISWGAADVQPGSHAVTVQVYDGLGGFDQQSYTLATQTGLPADLTISNVDRHGLVYDGQALTATGTVTAEITNLGTSDVSNPFDILFFEDRDHDGLFTLGIDPVFGTVPVTSGIAAGQTITISAQLSGSVLFIGNIVWGFADSGNVIWETDETNNLAHSGEDCTFYPQPGQFDPVVEWEWTTSEVFGDEINPSAPPSILDLDGDQVPEVVFVSSFALQVLRGDTGEEFFTVYDLGLQLNSHHAVAAGDIDLDGKPEILAHTRDYTLICFEHDGTLKWESQPLEEIPASIAETWGASAIADLDGDGVPEIIEGRQVLNSDGSIRWTGTGGRGFSVVGPLSIVADLNMDGSPEVIAGNTAYTASGDIHWQISQPDGFNAVANFDSDPFPEVVLVSSGSMWLLEHDGIIKWGPVSIHEGAYRSGPPTIADFDSDGEAEIGVAGRLYYTVFEADGGVRWTAPTSDGSGMTGSTVFDFDGDGSVEVVYSDELDLWIYRGVDGTVLMRTPMSSRTRCEYPVVADVDADGHAELIVVAHERGYGPVTIPQRGIYVFGDASDTWVPSRQIWNQHSYHVTNVNDDGVIPTHEVNSWDSHNTYRCNIPTGPGDPHAAANLTASYVQYQITTPPAPNLAPVAEDQLVSTLTDTPLAITLGALDPEGDPLVFTVVNTPANGTLSGTAPSLTYTPNPGYNGQDSFTFIANDGSSDSKLATVTITVSTVANHPPHAQDQAVTTAVDTAVGITLVGSDIDGDSLTFTIVTGPGNGSLSGSGPNLAYTPITGYTGQDIFTFITNDGVFDSNVGTVTITVGAPTGNPPWANDQVVSTLDTPVNITLTATDPDGDPLTYTIVHYPTGGTLAGTAPNLTYTPNTDYDGPIDSFTFQVNDGVNSSNLATAEIKVMKSTLGDGPTADDQSVSTTVGNPVPITMTGLDRQTVPTYHIIDPPAHGTLSDTDGSANRTYTPNPGYFGFDSFTFVARTISTIRPGEVEDSIPATVKIMILRAGNNIPVAESQTFTAYIDTPRPITLTAVDPDQDPLTIQIVTSPVNGTLSGTGENLTYTPAPGFAGFDSFTFQASDGIAFSQTETVDITVAAWKFTEIDPRINPGVGAWGDYDNDGDLDLAVTWAYVSRIYRNDGGIFTDIQATLIGVKNCSLAWSDYDNDGDLDLTIVGADPPITVVKIYRNDAGVFVDSNIPLGSGGEYGAIAWGDYDADGDEDLAVSGWSRQSNQKYSKIYRNDNGQFVDIGAPLVNVQWGSLAWGDYDNDGDLDLALTGDGDSDLGPGFVPISKIYRNNGGVFVDINASLTGVIYSDLDWADYDNDGDLDLVIVGDTRNIGYLSEVYRNDGGIFTNIGANLPTAITVDWVDYDNDGDPDLSVGGYLYRNDNGSFTDSYFRAGFGVISLDWGDYDNDGDLDAILLGRFYSSLGPIGVTRLYRNELDNSPSVASSQFVQTDQDTAINLILGATDSEGDPLTYSIVDLPSHGTLSGQGQHLIYTPNADYTGTDSFTFKTNDGFQDSNLATVIITVGNDEITFTVRIGNGGAVVAPAGVSVSLYEGDPQAGGVYLGSAQTTVSLDPGYYEDVQVVLPIASVNDLWVWADDDGTGTGQVNECNEADNIYQPGITIGQLTDLTITNVDRSGLTYDGQALTATGTVTADVTNLGLVDVNNPFDVLFFEDIDHDGFYNAAIDNVLGSTTITNPLLSGQTVTVSTNVSGSVLFLGNIIWGFVDSGDTILETNEANNLAHSGENCQFVDPVTGPVTAANLTASYVHHQTNAGQTTITARVGNGGAIIAPAGVSVSFYDGNPQAGGLYLGSVQTTSALTPGYYEDVQITLPAANINDLWIWADDDGTGTGQVNECNEADNLYDSGLSIIIAANQSPSFTSSPVTDATIGSLYRYDAAAFDPDGDPLAFDLPVRPSGMAVDTSTGIVIWTPRSDQTGLYDVMLRVRDGKGGVALQSFQVLVDNPNTAPSITSIPWGPAADGILYQYQVTAQDAEADTLTFALDTAPDGMTIDESTGLLSWTPLVAQVGSHLVILSADDGRGATAWQSFELPVVEDGINDPPAITSSPRASIALGRTYLYQIEATDPNSDPLVYSFDAAPTGMTVDDAGLVEWVPTADQFGSNTVVVRVEDGRGGWATQEFAIDVVSEMTNSIPQITSAPIYSATVGVEYSYNAEGEDADGDPLFWQLDDGPAGMSINAAEGTIRWTPSIGQLGPNEVAIRVLDGQGGWATQTFTLTVHAVNGPPAITSIPPTQGYVGYDYSYSVEATDPDGDQLQYSLDWAPAGMTVDTETGLIQWTPQIEHVGTWTVGIAVADGRGGLAQQQYEVVVLDEIPNNPPYITSVPVQIANAGDLYTYDVEAIDPEGESVIFSLTVAPTGMTIDPDTGLVQWTPTVDQLGLHDVTIVATDPAGAQGQQAFSMAVTTDNQAPIIHSFPEHGAVADLLWSYDVVATDPDGDALTYSLIEAPAGMIIDELGRVRWTPNQEDEGFHQVYILVADTLEAAATQGFELPVIVDDQAPSIYLEVSQNPAEVGTEVIVYGWASDNVGIESAVVTLDGVPLAMNSQGRATLQMDTVGEYELAISATDLAGNTSADSLLLLVIDTSDLNPPDVEITSPASGDTITTFTDVIGTVSDDNLLSYSLEFALASGGDFTEIAQGSDPVIDDVLGTFDPTVLANDTYILRLTATDAGGNIIYAEIEVGVAGELKLGNFTLSFVDLSIPVSGIPMTVARTYDSLDFNYQRDFGYGWRLEISDTNLTTSLSDTGMEDIGIFSTFEYGTKVYVTLPGGKREGFTFQPTGPRGGIEALLKMWHPAFTPDPGVTSRLTVQDLPLIYVSDYNEFHFYGGWGYNPADTRYTNGIYTLITQEGLEYQIDALTGSLQTLSDLNGNTLTYTQSSIRSSTGVSVDFERDARGRITSLIDPAGNSITYAYDAAGDLISVTDRDGNVTQFVYRSDPAHYLDEIIDPLGRTGVRTDYDTLGRLITMTDASGNIVGIAHNPDQSMETVTDALGNVTIYVYDERGNVVTEVDALGNITQRTYDPYSNYMLTETDPLGNTTIYTYDSHGNMLTQTDPLGNVTYYTYGSYGRLLTVTDPLGNTTTNTYDGSGNLLSTTDALGNTTTYTYDGAGNMTSTTDALGNVTTYQYDTSGNLIRRTDALSNSTAYTYDSNGNQTSMTDPLGYITTYAYSASGNLISQTDALGNVTITEYNAVGKVSTTIDALGRRTEYVYDERGQLIQTIYPDGTSTSTEYDAAGRAIARIDELGRRTEFVYDALGRQIQTVFSDGAISQTEYNAVGQMVATIDPLGNRTEFEYDAAGRQILVRDALGYETTTAYDAAGRMISTTDALGNTTQYVYDALGRVIQTILADGSVKTTTYDALGRVISETDQAGRITQFEYDALGRLTAVVDALGQSTQYTYDAVGNHLTQTDASGNTTSFTYDALGRKIGTTLPMGQSSSTTYNAVGTVVSTTDFNGDTIAYTYDVRNRLTAKNYPDSTSVTFTYTLTGQRDTVTDSRGTTTYAYDVRGRLTSRTDPDGTAISYTYDVAGNRTSVAIPSGTTVYTYDALNRMETVTDPDGGMTTYTYDAVGRLIQTDLPNHTVDTRTYDSLHRLLTIQHSNTSGIFAGFTYAYDTVGNRISVTEANGRQVDYAYDDLNRLVSESITDAVNGNRTISYVYDPVGNRLTRNDSVDGATTYVYDANDRLLTETLGVQVTTYTYDNNGNTITKGDGTITATNHWDYENRLVAVDTDGDGVVDVTYEYDANGIRVSKTEGGQETRFLIDANRRYAQVLAEYAPGGAVSVSYVYGTDLISQKRGAVTSYYHVDGLGSTRVLTDVAGVVTDTYIYDAYGRTIAQTGGTENLYLFAGEQRDHSIGLDYLRARYMGPGIGRFYGMDSFKGFLQQPLSLHRYQYANANPARFTDPSGRLSLLTVYTAITSIPIVRLVRRAFRVKSWAERVTLASAVWWLRFRADGKQLKPGHFVTAAGGWSKLQYMIENVSTPEESILYVEMSYKNQSFQGKVNFTHPNRSYPLSAYGSGQSVVGQLKAPFMWTDMTIRLIIDYDSYWGPDNDPIDVAHLEFEVKSEVWWDVQLLAPQKPIL